MRVNSGNWTYVLQTGQFGGWKGVNNVDTRWMTSDPIALTRNH